MRSEEGNRKAAEIRRAWNRENIKSVGANIRVEEAAELRRIADAFGTTPSGMIRDFVRAVIEGQKESTIEHYSQHIPNPNFILLTPETMDRLKNKTSRYKMNPYKLADKVLSAWMDMDDTLLGKKKTD